MPTCRRYVAVFFSDRRWSLALLVGLTFRRCVLLKWELTESGSNRVLRGGSWNNNAKNCRSANRNNNTPENRNNNYGFRLALARRDKVTLRTGKRPVCLDYPDAKPARVARPSSSANRRATPFSCAGQVNAS
ncbi:MAG: SUMF1/EgtB/PvdO family nonheme iron enzyme [Planctomycetia bacterium]|nr:SUMF1/EgtB/PvdO family nonheme iron enzyme [Planctomycetia bacterium]